MLQAPDLTTLLLQPVRAYYVLPFGGLSSVYEPRESVAVSNWQSRGKTKAQAILVEYLIEYHSSALIKLDRGGQQSEQPPPILSFFHFQTRRAHLCRENLHDAASEAPESQKG